MTSSTPSPNIGIFLVSSNYQLLSLVPESWSAALRPQRQGRRGRNVSACQGSGCRRTATEKQAGRFRVPGCQSELFVFLDTPDDGGG